MLRGLRIDGVGWDPRLGPDRERSGVLSVGKDALKDRVTPGERLRRTIDVHGVIDLA